MFMGLSVPLLLDNHTAFRTDEKEIHVTCNYTPPEHLGNLGVCWPGIRQQNPHKDR